MNAPFCSSQQPNREPKTAGQNPCLVAGVRRQGYRFSRAVSCSRTMIRYLLVRITVIHSQGTPPPFHEDQGDQVRPARCHKLRNQSREPRGDLVCYLYHHERERKRNAAEEHRVSRTRQRWVHQRAWTVCDSRHCFLGPLSITNQTVVPASVLIMPMKRWGQIGTYPRRMLRQ